MTTLPSAPRPPLAPAHQALHQLGTQRREEVGEEARPHAQGRLIAAKQEVEEGLPLGEALQGLAHQEGDEGKLELACGRERGGGEGAAVRPWVRAGGWGPWS